MALTKAQRRALLLLRHRIQLKDCVLRFEPEQRHAIAERSSPSRVEDDTEEIREAIRLYRESWIEPLLDALLNCSSSYSLRTELRADLKRNERLIDQLEQEDSCDD